MLQLFPAMGGAIVGKVKTHGSKIKSKHGRKELFCLKLQSE